MKQKRVVIIGAGLGGLATAALLAKDGHDVRVLEKNERPGGRANFFEEKGFGFDMGPSWYMMPEVFERFFGLFGKKVSDYLTLVKLDPRYRIYYEQGESLDIHDNINQNYELFERIEPGSAAKLKEFLQISKRLYQQATEKLVYNHIEIPGSLGNWGLIKEALPMLMTTNLLQSLDGLVSKYIKDERLKKILEFPAVFLGASPYNMPAFYSLINHADFELKIWYPLGGMHELAKALARLAEEMGATIECEREVTKVVTKAGKVVGVKLGDEMIEAEVVIGNADYHHVETSLLEEKDQSYPEAYWQSRTLAISAYMLYLGVNKKLEGLQHHTFFFGSNWKRGFDEVYTHPQWQTDPSYYVCCPSMVDKSVAPKNQENLFFLVPMAAGLTDDDETREAYFEKIMKHFETAIGQDVRSHIVVKRIFSQRDFTSMFHAYKGTALGLAHTIPQSLFGRPSMKSKKVGNLYYVGQYTQPGIGMPLVIISAEVLTKMLRSA
jgi:phytoene desaturase